MTLVLLLTGSVKTLVFTACIMLHRSPAPRGGICFEPQGAPLASFSSMVQAQTQGSVLQHVLCSRRS